MDLVVGLREVWSGIVAILDDDPDWGAPTPCDGWDVHDVAAHLAHIEGLAHGLEQPPTPAGFDPEAHQGFHGLTEEGVAARRAMPHPAVVDEIRVASGLSLQAAEDRDEEAWDEPAPSPIGMVPARHAAEMRLADAYVHLLDLRQALGIRIDPADEPTASRLTVARAVRLSGWGAVKQAGLSDGSRIRLEIDGAGGDLVVAGGRGGLEPFAPDAEDRIVGSGLAFLVAASGRAGKIDAGELEVVGATAARFLDGYRLFL